MLPALLNLLADIRAAYHLYHTLHLQSRGPNFYGDHLLFQRLYEAKFEQIDSLSEIIAGHYGSDKLDPVKTFLAAAEKVKAAPSLASPVQIAEMVIECCENVNEMILETGECPYPAGLSNFVSDLSTKNIGDLYLLKQRFGAKAVIGG